MEYERFVVVPDLHGRIDMLSAVVHKYDDEGICIVSLGDLYDSKIRIGEIKECFDLMVEQGDRVQLTKGNHEFMAYGVAACLPEYREEWVSNWASHGSNTLLGYGVTPAWSQTDQVAEDFRHALQQAGHFELLRNAPLYREYDEFIVVHAGISRVVSWDTQKRYLDELHAASLSGEIRVDEQPPQLWSHTYSGDSLDPTMTNKTVISGHGHMIIPTDERLSLQGRRVRLASKIHEPSAPLYVWESWTGQVVEISPQEIISLSVSKYRETH